MHWGLWGCGERGDGAEAPAERGGGWRCCVQGQRCTWTSFGHVRGGRSKFVSRLVEHLLGWLVWMDAHRRGSGRDGAGMWLQSRLPGCWLKWCACPDLQVHVLSRILFTSPWVSTHLLSISHSFTVLPSRPSQSTGEASLPVWGLSPRASTLCLPLWNAVICIYLGSVVCRCLLVGPFLIQTSGWDVLVREGIPGWSGESRRGRRMSTWSDSISGVSPTPAGKYWTHCRVASARLAKQWHCCIPSPLGSQWWQGRPCRGAGRRQGQAECAELWWRREYLGLEELWSTQSRSKQSLLWDPHSGGRGPVPGEPE